jgi:hypothetical protein
MSSTLHQLHQHPRCDGLQGAKPTPQLPNSVVVTLFHDEV